MGEPLVERHPFEPFLPEGAKVLMLGSFPPQPKRWSMEFYYPNFINDFWRIVGIIFFGDKDRFVDQAARKFRLDEIKEFCSEKGIAMFDTAVAVRRLKDNASDKFLEVVEPTDIPALLRRIPDCRAVVVTGEKASATLCGTFGTEPPAVGEYSSFTFEGRPMRLYRMPSTSRAYPLPIQKKADAYRRLFVDLRMV
ncbi:MAG: uracil-DNA glycosylase family protein [Bacteroidales bacterium]|nr:uracil-DNA glycosylase family protein [Bacteroidales bacterium]